MKQKALVLLVVGALATGSASAAFADASYTLFGNASIVPGGNPGNAAQLISDTANATTPYGGVDLTSTTVTTLSSVTYLGTDYQMTAGDCGGGSPRFEIGLTAGNIFIYAGPAPNFTGCATGWQATGNLLAGTVDTSQIGGTFYDTWAHALTLAGGSTVNSIDVVVDGSWSQPNGLQTALVDNIRVNADVVTFDATVPGTKADCKNGGWQSVMRGDGSAFKNQGDCVQYFNTGK